MVMLPHSHRLQPVAMSCTTAVAQYENPATATEKSSCYKLGSVGLQFFAVAATITRCMQFQRFAEVVTRAEKWLWNRFESKWQSL